MRAGPLLAKPDEGDDRKLYRTTAEKFRDALDEIKDKMTNENYVFTGKSRTNAGPPSKLPSGTHLGRPSTDGVAGQAEDRTGNRLAGGTTRRDYRTPPLEDWEFPVDNSFAKQVLDLLGPQAFQPRSTVSAELCQRCNTIDFWSSSFTLEEKSADLQAKSAKCGFCRMLWDVCKKADATKTPTVLFERSESTLRLTGTTSLSVLSLFRSPDLKTPLPIQIGFAELPQPGMDAFFNLIQLWLQDCDQKHHECPEPKQMSLPTRLIDLGTRTAPKLCLLETRKATLEGTDDRYIALSHPWGDRKEHPPFCTLKKNLQAFKSAIPEADLPATFKDAVRTTRALGVRYLWIDSLCIIQKDNDDGGDFSEEAKNMESVFSCAYCVIAASRALGQRDGFLKPQPQRECLTFQRGAEKPFYVCPIDDFGGDVLEGSLNRRGWVLQERALARRTIFFAEKQTYFECGQGVRCQSLAKMHNNMADLLGDPSFPDKAMKSTRGTKIKYFQELYKQYSRLELSFVEDRPFAIEGLENRLRAAYRTEGGFGIFDDGPGQGYFPRSLLWQRDEGLVDKQAHLVATVQGQQPSQPPAREEEDKTAWLELIKFPPNVKAAMPTWSWMAYEGAIDYLDPPFQSTEWEKQDIRPPWSTATAEAPPEGRPGGGVVEIAATVRSYNVARPARDINDVKLVFDTNRSSKASKPRVVVVAKAKEGSAGDGGRRHYVLLVAETDLTAAGGEKVYHRVGAGYMLGKYILFDEPGTPARIQ